jgi:hypothetical protein
VRLVEQIALQVLVMSHLTAPPWARTAWVRSETELREEPTAWIRSAMELHEG